MSTYYLMSFATLRIILGMFPIPNNHLLYFQIQIARDNNTTRSWYSNHPPRHLIQVQQQEHANKTSGMHVTVGITYLSRCPTGTSILKGVDDYMALLDEHITMTQAMTFSTFKGPFEERIENWNSTLQVPRPCIDYRKTLHESKIRHNAPPRMLLKQGGAHRKVSSRSFDRRVALCLFTLQHLPVKRKSEC